MGEMSMKITVNNLMKEFKQITVVNNVSASFESGKIYGLIGRNGSGKSVFLKMLCGFYVPTSGEILFDGVDYIKENGFPKNTRAMIEKPDFIPDLTGFENLKLLASIQNKIGDEEIIKALEEVNLINDKDKKFSKYSLGMKQKLGIAQVIMENPNVMIFDEPFNGIEEETVIKLRNTFKKYASEGKLIIIASHIKEDIETLIDCVYKFDNGIVKMEEYEKH